MARRRSTVETDHGTPLRSTSSDSVVLLLRDIDVLFTLLLKNPSLQYAACCAIEEPTT